MSRRALRALGAAVLFACTACAATPARPAAESTTTMPSDTTTTTTATKSTTTTTAAVALPEGYAATVERVVDGDTIVLAGGERVRFIGVDTPETKDPRKTVQCFGAEAAAHTSALLPPGTPVRLVYDVERHDRYGRTLAYVYRAADGVFVNADLVANGFAQILTVPPNVAHADEFLALQAAAREANRGLWSGCG